MIHDTGAKYPYMGPNGKMEKLVAQIDAIVLKVDRIQKGQPPYCKREPCTIRSFQPFANYLPKIIYNIIMKYGIYIL